MIIAIIMAIIIIILAIIKIINQNSFDVSTLLGSSLRLVLEHSVFPMDSKVVFSFFIIISIIITIILFIMAKQN